MFPNGNITKYIVKHDLSSYSPWKQDLDWCRRQVFSNREDENNNVDEGNGNKAPNGEKAAAILHSTVLYMLKVQLCPF